MRNLKLILIFLSILCARDVLAACNWNGTPPPLVKDITLPAKTIIKSAAIGQELAKHRLTLWSNPASRVSCPGSGNFTSITSAPLLPSALPNVYETGIKGVGVKFCITLDMQDKFFCAPYSWGLIWNAEPFLPRLMEVVFVRTGRGVASGKIPGFNVTWEVGGLPLLIRSQGTTELVNDIFFAGCESVGGAVNVPMGKQTTQNIKNGRVNEIPFNFDVRCEGLKPDSKVPVKVYFEGDSQTDGMLKLSNAGQAGVASGVGISLVNDKGVKLPFSIARSVALDWNRETEDGSIYRFSGKAKYVPTAGEMKAGKGDATMSFVLNYN
ncbi:fimbrial protein [Pseudomonas sp. SBT1-2]|uniref:fimbrial protein n=1 Tax=Pseudomonas sp. SBT1-2 TaxID=3027852 RepID=UPI002360BC54|nr:fimbrial protein [Pseudomonas sp. SBT1-2]